MHGINLLKKNKYKKKVIELLLKNKNIKNIEK